jgi:serine/threonine protein kinase/tetratricopeptide (TPR) repeat protein
VAALNPQPTQLDPEEMRLPAPPTAAESAAVDAIAVDAVTSTAGLASTIGPTLHPTGDNAPLAESETVASGEADGMIRQRLGAYQIVARLGGGGMGSVYRAERVVGFEQQVAIKLIKRGMDSEAIVRRFRTEIHFQAALSKHPNIAKLIDAGTVQDGRPYFVMEYIDGQRIDEYCDGRQLDVAERLRLFDPVCDAVQFAHQHAIIHRDLKCGNILVTADGVPKLIDFGIAKLMDPESAITGAGGAETLTRTGELVMTPDYASPEQVEGEPATTASDVYALGVVLYQLLTGHEPYRLKTRTVSEIFKAICEQAPERPSLAVLRGTSLAVAAARGTTPAGLQRVLTGDLDMIVLLALRKEPERRYVSPAQLALDLRRQLEGLPVSARADSTFYRVGKFVRRHAAAVAVSVALLLALVTGVIGTTTGLIMARRERDRALASSRKARQAVDQFFTRVSEERLLNQPGMHPLRKQLLQDAARFYEGFVAEHGGEPSLRIELASAKGRLADITAEVGSLVEADGRFRQAIALWDEILRSNPGTTDIQEKLARTLNQHANVLLRTAGRREAALKLCLRARALLEPLARAPLAPVLPRQELGGVLLNLSVIQFELAQPREASATLHRALAIYERLAAEDSGALEPRIGMAKCHAQMGQILLQERDGITPALESYQTAVDIREAIIREHPDLAEQALFLAIALGDLCAIEQLGGKLDSALGTARRAVEVFERLDRQYPGVLDYQEGLASTYNILSDVHRRRQELDESLSIAETARPLLERLVVEHPEYVHSRIDLAKTYNNIGRARQQSGEVGEALRAFQHAVDTFEGLRELGARDSYNLACNLALCIPLIGAKEGSKGVLDPDAGSKSDRKRRQTYADRAMEVLRRAVRGGFQNIEILQSDPDLLAIRSRDDFQQIIEEIGKSTLASPK